MSVTVEDEEFVTVQTAKNRKVRPQRDLQALERSFDDRVEQLRVSKVFLEMKSTLLEYSRRYSSKCLENTGDQTEVKSGNEDQTEVERNWPVVRCLALGSPSLEPAAMYQLALLHLLKEELNVDKIVSYDPAYTDIDKEFLRTTKLSHDICTHLSEIETNHEKVLYFMPHVPIVILESLLAEELPLWLVTNDLLLYSDKWTDSEFFAKYPNTARVAKMIKKTKKNNDTNDELNGDFIDSTAEFELVTNKNKNKNRSKGKNNNNKKKFVPVPVDYEYDKVYYSSVEATKFMQGNDFNHPWNEAFGNLSFIGLTKKKM